MRNAEAEPSPKFYFALARLVAKCRGGNGARTEQNWIEANLVGLAVFGISFLFLARLLPGHVSGWPAVALLVPLAFVAFLSWLLVLYVNSLLLRLVRAAGFMRNVTDSRAQCILVAALTTVLAFCLLRSDSWMRIAGAVWIIGVVLNFLSAALLAGSHADHPAS